MFNVVRKSTVAVLALILPVWSVCAQSNDDIQSKNYIIVGAGILEQHTPFKLAATRTAPIPFISVKQGAYYIEAGETGLHFDRSLAGVTPSLAVFLAARSRQGRDRAKLSADAGVRVSFDSRFGKLSGELRGDVSDKFNGSELIARYSYPVSIGRFTITPAVQASWLDRKAANYMYGITAAQRARMIRKKRSVILPAAPITEEAVNLGGDISMTFQLNERLMLIAFVGGAYLDKSIHRSAAIEQEWEAQSGLGVAYRF
jgi:outer membrane scaffolding protein for murein synthesis (MipA/OmpV family)